MRVVESEAIVLSVADYGEADKIVSLFCKEHGKIRCFARNAKRSSKRFGGSLEAFARIRPQLVLKDSLSRLDSVDLVTIFPYIRNDLASIGYACYACELVDRLIPEAQSNGRLYRLLCAYLEYLDSSPATEDDQRFFQVNLLNILGYRIPVDSCAACGASLSAVQTAVYHPSSGDFSCGCAGSGRKLSEETISTLELCMRTGKFGKVSFSDAALREAGEILDNAVSAHLSRPLDSLLFLREVLPNQQGGIP